MTTIKRRAPRRHITQLGERTGISLDPLTKSRIIHGVHIARLLGIETNHAGVVRAAVGLYIDHIDSALKELSAMEVDSPEAKHLVVRETYRLRCANRGGRVPWRDEGYLEGRLDQVTREVVEFGKRFPQFAELIRESNAKRLQILAELKTPDEELQEYLNGGDE